jgi:hypothetical protein
MPTAYDIYQTYLQGPGAVIRLFEQTFGAQAIYGRPEPDQQQRTIDTLGEELERLKTRVVRLSQERGAIQGENHRLRRRLGELEGLLTKDSHNSSRPPSTDPPWRKRTRNLRQPTDRRPGGQPGHPGHTRPLARRPSRVVTHRPAQCRHCLEPLAEVQSAGVERRQVIDIVPARLRVTEHRAETVRCPHCRHTTKVGFPAGIRAPVQYGPGVRARALYLHDYGLLPYGRVADAMRELFGCALSAGTLANLVAGCAAGLIETELQIKKKLRRSSVIHADETGMRVGQRLQYVHVASTQHLTHYAAAPHRGRTAMDEINVLPRYRGVCVHDGLLSYSHYTRCRHALCGVHLLRELTYFAELTAETKAWAAPLKELLLEMKGAVEREREGGGTRLDASVLAELSARYDRLVAEGQATTTPPELPEGVRKQARNLLLRFERRREEVLLFLTDFRVPFDNNQAERDLRMVKLQQKVSGCFRSEEGAHRFCRIRSYLSTMRKQGRGVLHALEGACRGKPLGISKRKE